MYYKQISAIMQNPSWDIIVLFAFISLGFFYGLFSGKHKLVLLILSLYISGFIFENFSYLDKMTVGKKIFEVFFFKAIVFAIIVTIINLLFSKVFESNFNLGEKKWWQSFLLSFSSSGLFFSYVFHLFPARKLFTFSPITQTLFAADTAFFWWLMIPLIVLFITRK